MANDDLDRVPPHSIEAEQSTLGAMLLEKDAIATVVEYLSGDSFYREAHKHIFNAVVDIFNSGQAVDLVTINEQLRKKSKLEEAGGAAYISSLANNVPTAANVEQYARIVQEKAILRSLIHASARIAALGYEGADSLENILDRAEQLIFNVTQKRSTQEIVPLKDILMQTFDSIEYLYEHKGGVTGLPSGFSKIDEYTSGFKPSEFIIIAARPSMGKTSLALNIAQYLGVEEGAITAIFSLEMSREQLAQRLLCSEARVDSHRLRTGHVNSDDWPRLSHALGSLSEAPIFVDDTPGISVMEMRAKARRLKAEHGLDLIMIDYLQLMASHQRSENRQQEVSDISRGLKALARELDIPVIALSQLSRKVEERKEKIPNLADLRESGSLEQDADLVAFIYRDAYYNQDSEEKGIARFIIGKQRNGPVGEIKLAWHEEYTRFDDLEEYRDDPVNGA